MKNILIKCLVLFILIILFYDSQQCSSDWPKKHLNYRCAVINGKINCDENETKVTRFLG